ncbi:MAG: Ppx/GppA family phosphatase [Deltaproteobacteria bacterium]|nr:Ppx/GppA family phosphatase [Deltaproteobacteria bacterium]
MRTRKEVDQPHSGDEGGAPTALPAGGATRAPVIAAIDVGTNSVLLLVVRQDANGVIEVLANEARITRIGEGIGTSHALKPEAMARTLSVLKEYSAICRMHGAATVSAVGTAAFRRVANGQQFLDQVRAACGFDLEIISGQREAQLSYLAAATDFGPDLLVCDIGGGSTEYIWRSAGKTAITAISLPLGSVTLHETFCHSDPINDADYEQTRMAILSELTTHLGSRHGGGAGLIADRRPDQLVALAGTATTLAAMCLQLREYRHWEVHGKPLTLAEIETLRDTLRARTIAERKQLPGLEPARADVILPGAILLAETMNLLDYDQVTISDRGVRWGLVYEQCKG